MLYATKDDQKIRPQPGMRAKCPACGDDVIAKCGGVKVWHWSHLAADCDPWSEPETEWHLTWKERFPQECREVVIGNHRADVLTKSGIVIEFQHSSISTEEIEERESFYGERMMWVIDASPFSANVGPFIEGSDDGLIFDLEWRFRRKTWWSSRRPKFFCFGDRGMRGDWMSRKKGEEEWTGKNNLLYIKELYDPEMIKTLHRESYDGMTYLYRVGTARSVSVDRFLGKYAK